MNASEDDRVQSLPEMLEFDLLPVVGMTTPEDDGSAFRYPSPKTCSTNA